MKLSVSNWSKPKSKLSKQIATEERIGLSLGEFELKNTTEYIIYNNSY